MKIPILIEPIAGKRFRATGGQPFGETAEADTAEAALAAVQQLIRDRVAQGAMIASVDLNGGANPWLAGAGMFKDDAMFADWQQAIAENRKALDETAAAP